jgi:tRNA A-37 threonylcarbamoyl transferase component Bud32
VKSNEEMQRLHSKGYSALAKMHANGVYHGDIRAENILWIPSTERFIILDFDLAIVFSKNEGEHKEWIDKMPKAHVRVPTGLLFSI